MDRVKEYLSNPTTWISFTVFVFWLGWAWVSLNARISAVEKAQADMDIAYIQWNRNWILKTLILAIGLLLLITSYIASTSL